jgi:hypothetical protein
MEDGGFPCHWRLSSLTRSILLGLLGNKRFRAPLEIKAKLDNNSFLPQPAAQPWATAISLQAGQNSPFVMPTAVVQVEFKKSIIRQLGISRHSRSTTLGNLLPAYHVRY